MSQPTKTTAAVIRARIKHTAMRAAHLARVLAALQQLNVSRRRRLKELAAQKPLPPVPEPGPTTMFDSISISNMPSNAPAVAGYVGGRWPTFQYLAAHFPNAKRLSVAVASYLDADCLDIEPGDAPVSLAPAWFKRQVKRGVKKPALYTSASQVPALVATMRRAGIRRDAYRIWSAHYTGHAHLCGPSCGFGITDTADATQWTDKALGRSLDQSLLTPQFFE